MIAEDYAIVFMDTTNATYGRESTAITSTSDDDDAVICSLTGILGYLFFGSPTPHNKAKLLVIPPGPLNRQSDYCDVPAPPRGERSPLMDAKPPRVHYNSDLKEEPMQLAGESSPTSVLSEAVPPPAASLPSACKSYQRRGTDGFKHAKKSFNYHELSEERSAYLTHW